MNSHPIHYAIAILAVVFFQASYAAQTVRVQPRLLAHAVLTHDNQPSKVLTDLLGKLNIRHNGTYESIKAATQKEWIRPAGLEREECPELYPALRSELLPLFQDLGLVDEVAPTQKEYDHAIILSNMVPSMRQRVAFASLVCQRGIRFRKLHLVGSERVLHPKYESKEVLLDAKNPDLSFRKDWTFDGALPATDTPMLEFVYNQADLTSELRSVPMQALNVPNQIKPDRTVARATTGTQVTEWLKHNENPGSTVWISNAPYVGYQDSVVRTFVPRSLEVETIGPKADTEKYNFNQDCLDTIARMLYQEGQRRAKE